MKKSVLSAAILLTLLAPAHASDAPFLREGLWSFHMTVVETPGNKVVQEKNEVHCRSHATDIAEAAPTPAPGCTKTIDTFSAGVRHMKIECHMSDRDLESMSVVTYTGDTATHAVAHTVVTFKMGVQKIADGVTDLKYIGPCPARLKPGMSAPAPGSH